MTPQAGGRSRKPLSAYFKNVSKSALHYSFGPVSGFNWDWFLVFVRFLRQIRFFLGLGLMIVTLLCRKTRVVDRLFRFSCLWLGCVNGLDKAVAISNHPLIS